MLQDVEEISSTKKRLKIHIPSEVIQSETDSVYNEIRNSAKIPGFRPGKAPREILVKKFGKNVDAQVIEKIVPEYYIKAVKEAKIEPVNYPDIDERIELKSGQPLTFSVIVEIKPDLGEIAYDGMALKKQTFSVGDEEIDRAMKLLQESKVLYSVSDGELQDQDMAVINSEAFLDGASIDGLTYKEFPLILGSGGMPKEFGQALTGKKKGDSVEVKITFPEDHPNKTIAGRDVVFQVAVTEVKRRNLPPLDDEFAKENDCETMDALREKVREGVSKRKESQINLEYKKEILDGLIRQHSFDVPDSMVQGEIESLIHQEKENAMRVGRPPRPDDEIRKELEGKARDNVRSVIMLEAIGKKEKIEVTEDDIAKAMKDISERNSMKLEEIRRLYAASEGSLEALRSRLFADKVLDLILERATIQ